MSEIRAVVVTGGARGIGWAAAKEFLRHDWKVALADIDFNGAKERAAHAGPNAHAVHMDVRDPASVDRAMDQVLKRFGSIDCLINNAGVTKWTALQDIDWTTWSWILDVNLNGAARCLAAAGKRMIEGAHGGSIVNIISTSGVRGVQFRGPYTVSKAGVEALTRTAAVEWAAFGIRVNAVGPGYVSTDLVDDLMRRGLLDRDELLKCIPMARIAEPEEIGRVVYFLASDEASYVTGQSLFVDGGHLANSGLPGRWSGNVKDASSRVE